VAAGEELDPAEVVAVGESAAESGAMAWTSNATMMINPGRVMATAMTDARDLVIARRAAAGRPSPTTVLMGDSIGQRSGGLHQEKVKPDPGIVQ
jgi:hypothetical protein